MPLFNVYPLYDVTPVSAKGVYVYDKNNTEYLDLYGGHAVISIGHGHPKYVEAISKQVAKLGFYSNAIQNPLHKNNWYPEHPESTSILAANFFCNGF